MHTEKDKDSLISCRSLMDDFVWSPPAPFFSVSIVSLWFQLPFQLQSHG